MLLIVVAAAGVVASAAGAAVGQRQRMTEGDGTLEVHLMAR